VGEILFIAHRLPFPPDRGDKIRSHYLLRHLAGLGPVHVACFADDEADAVHEGELAALAQSHCLVPRSRPLPLAGLAALATGRPVSLAAFADGRLQAYVDRVAATRPLAAIVVFSGQMGQYVPAGWTGPLVVDFVDVDSAKFGAYAAAARGPMSWVHAREDRLLRAEEGRLAARADASLLVSEPEAELFRTRLGPDRQGRCKVVAIGNGIDVAAYDPEAVAPEPRMAAMPGPRVIFTGQMDYPPNVAAVVRAASRIMPLVRRFLPAATFHVVGRKPAAEVMALHGSNGCHVWGRVDDIRPWLRAADIALVPLEIARGVQNKVLEAMAMASPVVATTAAATGIAAPAGQAMAMVDDDDALAAAVIRLAQDRHAAGEMGRTARAQVTANHEWAAMLAPVAGLLGRAAGEARDAA